MPALMPALMPVLMPVSTYRCSSLLHKKIKPTKARPRCGEGAAQRDRAGEGDMGGYGVSMGVRYALAGVAGASAVGAGVASVSGSTSGAKGSGCAGASDATGAEVKGETYGVAGATVRGWT